MHDDGENWGPIVEPRVSVLSDAEVAAELASFGSSDKPATVPGEGGKELTPEPEAALVAEEVGVEI